MNYARVEEEEKKPGIPPSKAEIDRIGKMFDAGMTAYEIANFIGRAPRTVLRYLGGRREATYPPVSNEQRHELLVRWRALT